MILLIEDRPERQKHFMLETGIDLNTYSDILDNKIEAGYHKLLADLENDTFDLSKYSVIVSHKSAFADHNVEILGKLANYCQTSKKPLVLFSGGIDANYYEKSEYETIEMNSKIFYSDHLKLFLENTRQNERNLLVLIYGNKWKLNTLLNVLEKINLFIENNTKEIILFKRFVLTIDYGFLDDLDLDIYKPTILGSKVKIDEIKKIGSDIEKHIAKVIINE